MVGNQWNWGSLPFNDSIICLGHENLYGEFNVLFLSFLWLGKVNLRISQQGLSYTICIQWNLSNTVTFWPRKFVLNWGGVPIPECKIANAYFFLFNVVATVQERLAADTTLPSPGGTRGSMEGACRDVMLVAGRTTLMRDVHPISQ